MGRDTNATGFDDVARRCLGSEQAHLMGDSLSAAIEALRMGNPVVFPTDTVYGVGVSVEHAASPQVLYDLKHRAAGKPVAWLVGGPEALDDFGRNVPDAARDLVRAHWPGALTVIVEASDAVPEAFRSAQGSIGLRMPASDVALALIRGVGCPIATTSANVSGAGDSCNVEDLPQSLVQSVPVVVAGDLSGSGTASTVVDCSSGALVVLRQGAIEI